jgi:hypothetical protein
VHQYTCSNKYFRNSETLTNRQSHKEKRAAHAQLARSIAAMLCMMFLFKHKRKKVAWPEDGLRCASLLIPLPSLCALPPPALLGVRAVGLMKKLVDLGMVGKCYYSLISR